MMRSLLFFSVMLLTLPGCVEEPVKESTLEMITKVILTFTPTNGDPAIIHSATDPDGDGVKNISPNGTIILAQDKTYTLSLALINELADPSSPEYNITNEVEEAGDEHLFFFAWTNNIFSSPSGNGNVDNRSDALNYLDMDEAGLPLGLSTSWKTTAGAQNGAFNILLKHQPGLKSINSASTVGETDLDITFNIEVQ